MGEVLPVEHSFEDFFELEQERLLRLLWMVTGSLQEAEDIVQDAFLRVWERWPKVASMESPHWLPAQRGDEHLPEPLPTSQVGTPQGDRERPAHRRIRSGGGPDLGLDRSQEPDPQPAGRARADRSARVPGRRGGADARRPGLDGSVAELDGQERTEGCQGARP